MAYQNSNDLLARGVTIWTSMVGKSSPIGSLNGSGTTADIPANGSNNAVVKSVLFDDAHLLNQLFGMNQRLGLHQSSSADLIDCDCID